MSAVLVLIPSYEPDGRLVDLVRELAGFPGLEVLVVDDGSGPAYASLFAEAGATGAEVLTHPANRGKGAALRTGFAHVLRHHPGQPVVCADSDGQHTVLDILRVAAAIDDDTDLVLGVRRFTGRVPLRSRVGNRCTSTLFALATGRWIGDTQTGLRGYPHRLLGWLLEIPGDRFEYELEALLRAGRDGLGVRQVEIATVYLAGNASSHFRPLADSVRVLRPLLGYAAASLGAFAVDAALLFLLFPLLGSLAAAAVLARLASGSVNFLANRHLVFRTAAAPLWPAVRRYAVLALGVFAANLALLELLTPVLGLLAAKLLTEVGLFAAAYVVQRLLVFVPVAPTACPRATRAPQGGHHPALTPENCPP